MRVPTLGDHPGFPYYCTATLFVFAAVFHGLVDDDMVLTDGIEVAIPVLIAVGICYGGLRFRDLDPDPETTRRVGVVVLGGGLFGALITALVGAIEFVEGAPLGEFDYVVLVGAATGSLLAAPVGHYYGLLRNRLVQLDEQYRQAERLRKQLSILDRVLRHNIRNELTVLYAAAESERTNGRVRSRLDRLLDLSETARRLRQVWDAESRVAVDVVPLLADLVEEVETDAPELTVRRELPASATVLANPYLESGLREAIENVVEHNDPAAVTLTVRVDDGGSETVVEIRDTGTGIPAVERRTLENPEESDLVHGLGLGLWTVYWVARESGGEFEIGDNEPSGTTVRLRLPSAPAEVDPVDRPVTGSA